ncbi:MAG TPA: hypothetical protein VN133_13700 [Humibacter sp.]|nr:hypothetical protein [Humibacter sp.]
MTENIDDVAQTLAEYERLAIKTGAKVQIEPAEFTADGETWTPLWLSNDHPLAARVRVHRDDIVTERFVPWAEAVPTESAMTSDGRRWCDLWAARPSLRIGSYITRMALGTAFRDAIGDRRAPDDEDVPDIARRVKTQEPVEVDWDAAIENAPNVVDLDRVWADMRTARARSGAREVAYKTRRAAMVRGEWVTSGDLPAPELSPEEGIRSRAFFGGDPAENMPADMPFAPVPARHVDSGASAGRPDIRRPQDHKPPQNRAARRASKKGRRS